MEEEYKGKFGPSQTSELQISEKSTDQDQVCNPGSSCQQLATQVVVTGIEENDVASDCSEEYIEDSVEKTKDDADGGLKSTLHCIRHNTI